jgi:hypothetical protein
MDGWKTSLCRGEFVHPNGSNLRSNNSTWWAAITSAWRCTCDVLLHLTTGESGGGLH